MIVGLFDTVEVVTLVASTIAFFFVFKAYRDGINTPTSKKLWAYFLLIAVFILLNRLFTNIEALAYKEIFNFIEHLAVLAASIVFVIVTRNATKGEANA